jgi:hypothetical protein
LISEAVGWLDRQPLFFRNCDAAWGTEDAESYLTQMEREPQADFGVFCEGELIAVITVSLAGKNVYNSHLMAKRGASIEAIRMAVMSVLKQMLEQGMKEGWMWLARKNLGVRRIVEAAGMRRDGLTRLRGQSHGAPIEWCRYSVRI